MNPLLLTNLFSRKIIGIKCLDFLAPSELRKFLKLDFLTKFKNLMVLPHKFELLGFLNLIPSDFRTMNSKCMSLSRKMINQYPQYISLTRMISPLSFLHRNKLKMSPSDLHPCLFLKKQAIKRVQLHRFAVTISKKFEFLL